MAFALVGIGLLLFVTAYHNNIAQLGSQLSSDLTGSKGFIIWVVAIFIIGAFGYVPALKGVSRIFLVLILVVIFLSNKGVFSQLTDALGVAAGDGDNEENASPVPPTPPVSQAPAAPKSTSTQSGASGGGGGW